MKIVPYELKYKNDFIALNKAWISHMFKVEEEDIREIENIELSANASIRGAKQQIRQARTRTEAPRRAAAAS